MGGLFFDTVMIMIFSVAMREGRDSRDGMVSSISISALSLRGFREGVNIKKKKTA